MSLSSEVTRSDYVGNASASSYNYAFRILDESHLKVVVRNPTTGAETILVLDTDYSVNSVGATTGSIDLIDASQVWLDGSGNLDTAWAITLIRDVDLTQNTDIRNQGDFFPEVHEDAFDKLTMIEQQQQDAIDRSVKMPVSVASTDFDPTLPAELTENPGASVMVNAAGDGFEVGPTADAIAGAQDSADDAAISAAAAAASAVTAAGSATAAAASAVTAAGSATAAAASAAAAVTTLSSSVLKATIANAGDILLGTAAATPDVLPIGTDNQVLTVDTTVVGKKMKWSAAAIGQGSQGFGTTITSSGKTLSAADDGKVLKLDSSGGTIAITAFAAAAGFKVTFMDVGGVLSTSAATLVRVASQKTQNVAGNYAMEADYGIWTWYFDGTDWWIGE